MAKYGRRMSRADRAKAKMRGQKGRKRPVVDGEPQPYGVGSAGAIKKMLKDAMLPKGSIHGVRPGTWGERKRDEVKAREWLAKRERELKAQNDWMTRNDGGMAMSTRNKQKARIF